MMTLCETSPQDAIRDEKVEPTHFTTKSTAHHEHSVLLGFDKTRGTLAAFVEHSQDPTFFEFFLLCFNYRDISITNVYLLCSGPDCSRNAAEFVRIVRELIPNYFLLVPSSTKASTGVAWIEAKEVA
jgi:hypothetical protein